MRVPFIKTVAVSLAAPAFNLGFAASCAAAKP